MPNTKPVGVAFSDPELTSGTTVSGAVIDNSTIGATTPAIVVGTTVYATTEIGYTAEASGTVTQLTDKSTGVTLNKSAGQITTNNAALANATNVTFTLTNSTISAKDVIILSVSSGATAGAYNCWISSKATGSCTITLRNISASPLSEAVVINFAVIHVL
jgi:hypothetical protein